MEPVQVGLFIVASLLVILTPGQDLLLVMSRAVSLGSKAGVVTAAGVSAGLLGHSVLAACGLGAILLASATLFALLKWIGAVYLFYLGVRMICSRRDRIDLLDTEQISSGKLLLTGAFSNISNPQITLFYFAFLPQFIPNEVVHPTSYLFCLGAGFAVLTFFVKGPVGYYAGVLSSFIRQHPSMVSWLNRTSGVLLIGLGVKLVLTER